MFPASKNGNRKYLEIRGIAEQIVNRLLAEQGELLTFGPLIL